MDPMDPPLDPPLHTKKDATAAPKPVNGFNIVSISLCSGRFPGYSETKQEKFLRVLQSFRVPSPAVSGWISLLAG